MNKSDLLSFLETYITENRKARFEEVLKNRTRYFTVAVEDVYQFHNTSAVLRSCDVFGIQDVHVIEEKYSGRMDGQIAMGAQRWVDIYKYPSAEACVKQLKASGYQIVATTPHKEDQLIQDFDIAKRSCFFFGRETEGLSDYIIENADAYLKIPMFGFTESLNISVSAAIILHHVYTRLKESELDWKLSETEKQDLKIKWCKKSIKSIDAILERYHSEHG